MSTDVNLRDLLFKLAWTMVNAGLAYAAVALAGVETWWALPLTAVIQWVSSWLRQRYGETPADLRSKPAFDWQAPEEGTA